MWTMGYNDSGAGDSFSNNARKLRPLVPRPLPSAPTNHPSTAPPAAPCLARIHGTDFFGLNHHHQLGSYFGEQNRRELDISSNTPPVVVSSRWNPTPEQLRTLEELYRRGTRTPSAEQIQHITAQLRRYGKIEGKNVFYWFQNHKARERQKRRRQIMESSADHHHHDHLNNHLDFGTSKESATSKTDIEIEQNKSLAAPVNAHCSTLLAEEPISFTKASTAENSGQIGWNQVDEAEAEAAGGEFQQLRRSLVEKNATWQMMQCSCPHLINTSRTRTPDHDRTAPTVVSAMVDHKQLMKGARDHLGVFFSPYVENGHCLNNYLNTVTDDLGGAEGWGESQTLQLFPLRSSGHGHIMDDKSDHKVITDVPATAMDDSHSPCQFFEFLPLKS